MVHQLRDPTKIIGQSSSQYEKGQMRVVFIFVPNDMYFHLRCLCQASHL
jgi:hypothetical protein